MSIHDVLTFINGMPAEVWETLIAGIFLSPLMIGVKKWLNVHHELVMMLYVIIGAGITAAVAYVQNTPDLAPWLVIPVQGLITFAVSQPAYFAIWKPLKKQLAVMVGEANQLNEERRSAVAPQEGVTF